MVKDAQPVPMNLDRETLSLRVQTADPDDLDAWREMLYERQRLIDACKNQAEAEALFHLGLAMETRLRIARAKLAAQSADCYQTGFLLRALHADLARPQTGASLDMKA
jgi:hypothetical protein